MVAKVVAAAESDDEELDDDLADMVDMDDDEDGELSSKRSRSTRSTLPRITTNMLKAWLYDHYHHPYPSDAEKETMSKQFKLSLTQINNWFINARRRLLQPLRKEGRDMILKHRQRIEASAHAHDESSNACFQALQRCISNLERGGGPAPTTEAMVSGGIKRVGGRGFRCV